MKYQIYAKFSPLSQTPLFKHGIKEYRCGYGFRGNLHKPNPRYCDLSSQGGETKRNR